MCWLLCAVVLSTSVTVYGETNATSFNFLLMVANPDFSTLVPTVDQTLEEINMKFKFEMKYKFSDNKCNATRALQSFYNEVVANSASPVAIIGCGCSTATEDVAKISHFWDIPVISYASTSVVLSDRSVYRNFYRTVPSHELLVPAVAAIMESYEWRQLSVFTEKHSQFLQFYHKLRVAMRMSSKIKSFYFSSEQVLNFTDFANSSAFVFNKETHIYLLNTDLQMSTLVLCTAYHNARFYPNYAWILLGHHDTDWWREHYMETNCTDTDMMKVLNRSLILTPYPDVGLENNTEAFESNVLTMYNSSTYVEDAVWTLAHAVNNCISSTDSVGMCSRNISMYIEDFSTDKHEVNFISGDRHSSIVIVQQYQIANEGRKKLARTVKFGYVMMETQNNTLRYLSNFNESTIWPDGIPPDGTPVMVITPGDKAVITLHLLLFATSTLFVIICLGFNIVYKNRKIVKLTSPNLNYVMIAGATALTLSVPSLEYLVTTSNHIAVATAFCTINRICLSVGFNVCIAVALVKTCRVVYIVKFPKPNKKPIKDWQLILAVGGIALIDVFINVPLLAMIIHDGDVTLVPNILHNHELNSEGVTENKVSFACGTSQFLYAYFGLTIAYKFILHVIGLVLTFLARNVQIDVLNDYHYNTTIIIISSILLLADTTQLGLIVYQTILQYFRGFITFSKVVVFLGLTFIPKMIALYKDPQGKKVFSKINPAGAAQDKSS